MVKDWDELEVEYIFAKNMKLTPNMKKLSNNYILCLRCFGFWLPYPY